MTVRERARSSTLTDFSFCIQWMLMYRMPMMVKEAVAFRRLQSDDIYYRCPRCRELLEREHMAYCSRCGQCLNWQNYTQAQLTIRKRP